MSVSTETDQYPILDTVECGHAVLSSPRGVRSRRGTRGDAASWGPIRRRRGNLAAALMFSLVLLGVFVAGGVMPYAGADDRQYEEFYTPPDPLPPGQPGDLIRTEPSRLALEPSGQLGAYVGTGTRIMYRSTDAQGNPVAVTGTYIEPDVPWPGNGPRPLLAYATGPYGAGEQCAPSRLFNQGIHFSQGFDLTLNVEEGWIATLLARGFAIVVTDGVGMGIHGPQSPQWLNREAAGTAMLDAAPPSSFSAGRAESTSTKRRLTQLRHRYPRSLGRHWVCGVVREHLIHGRISAPPMS